MAPQYSAVAVLLLTSMVGGTPISRTHDTGGDHKQSATSSRESLEVRMQTMSAIAEKVFSDAQRNQADPGVLDIIQKIQRVSEVPFHLDGMLLSSAQAQGMSLLEQDTNVLTAEGLAVDAVSDEDGETSADPTALDAIRQAREAAQRSRGAGVSTWGQRPAADAKTVDVLKKVEEALENHHADETATSTATTTYVPGHSTLARRRRRRRHTSLLELEPSDRAGDLEIKLKDISLVAAQRQAHPITQDVISKIRTLAETATSAQHLSYFGSVTREMVGRKSEMRSPRYSLESLQNREKQETNITGSLLSNKMAVDLKLADISAQARENSADHKTVDVIQKIQGLVTGAARHNTSESEKLQTLAQHSQAHARLTEISKTARERSASDKTLQAIAKIQSLLTPSPHVQGPSTRSVRQSSASLSALPKEQEKVKRPFTNRRDHDMASIMRHMPATPVILGETGESSSTGAKLADLFKHATLKSAHPTTLNAIKKFQDAV
eukprot:CAMPEP_0194550428 /NCGR_PEP_ID=MMETSP0253-20130528/95706_1 /TAXON_ID=2966 /ORGANISM="Noctiluca scintillans" /LENGTH=494 /DNA_ID=CAMNT_0039397867 /DNA_START=46 /DNA_END=1530 /DNA_ORIENTATION=+